MSTRQGTQTLTLLWRGAQGDRMGAGFALACALLVVAALLARGGEARAAMYKWVDEKGVVHYTDKMPPEAVDKARVELNEQGVPINKTDRALTPEQRRAIEQDAQRQREVERAREEIARRDRALVSSYTNEAEIDLARNRALQTINTVMVSSQAFSERLSKRRSEVVAKKATSQGTTMVAVLDREIESIDAEIERQASVIAQKKREAEVITAKYDADKQRWRELVVAKAAAQATSPTNGNGSVAAPTTGKAKK